jgi:undecaprenyl-diphosphatase
MEELITFDRWLLLLCNGSPSLFLDGLVKTLTTAATWIPLYLSLLYIVVRNNTTTGRILLVVLCAGLCVLLTGTLDDAIVKPLVARWRPTHDPVIGQLVDTVNGYRGGDYGFFSAHAANTFSIALFFSLLVRSRLLTVGLVVFYSLTNCWTRLYLGVHFPGDILCGLIWGGLMGTLVYRLYLRLLDRYARGRRFYATAQTTATGYRLVHVEVVIMVLVLTWFYAILRACFY